MPVQIDLSIEELARLVEHYEGHFCAAQGAAKGGCQAQAAGPQVIKSPNTQGVKTRAGAPSRPGREGATGGDAAQEGRTRPRPRAAAQREEQRRLAEAAQQQADEEPEAGPLPHGRAVSGTPCPGCAAPPQPVLEVPLPGPQFVAPPLWETVGAGAAAATPRPSRTSSRSCEATSTRCCALLRPDGQIRTWNELQAPSPDSPFAAEGRGLSPAKWVSIPRARFMGNTDQLNVLTAAGNYNEVLTVSGGSPVNDSTRWPPQLRRWVWRSQRPLRGCHAAHCRLRGAHDAHGPLPVGLVRPVLPCDEAGSLVDEMTLALQAAAQGIGPPIYAAVAWPWERQPETSGAKVRHDLDHAQGRRQHGRLSFRLRRAPENQPDPVRGPSPVLRRTVEEAAVNLIGLCFHIGWTQRHQLRHEAGQPPRARGGGNLRDRL